MPTRSAADITKTYSPKEWNALSRDQQQKVRDARSAEASAIASAAANKKPPGLVTPPKRNMASTVTFEEPEDTSMGNKMTRHS